MSAGGHGLTAVLFTDVVGSTELRGELGPDAADELRREHDAALTRAVERNHGRVVKGQGDGVMATFASTVDAAGAAIDAQQAIARLAATSGVSLQIRVGISAGDVSVEGDDVFGEPVIEAARLCDAADGGQVLCADLVPALSRGRGGHTFRSLGELELKGFADAIAVSELSWEPAGVEVPLPHLLASADGPIRFVGRDAELEALARLAKDADAGTAQLALLAGEPGMGKTRLVAEFARRAHAEGALVLAGRCDEDLGVPYQPFVEALRHFAAHVPADEASARLGRWGGELVRLMPELADLVDGLDPPVESDPETERYRLFEAVAHWLGSAGDGGVVLVLDDLHWAAKPTLLMMRHLLRSDVAPTVLVIGTYRQTDLDRAHPLAQILAELRTDASVTRLSLDGFDLDETEELMEAAAGHELAEDGKELAAALRRETNGLPLFVQQVLAHLAESGAIVQSDGRWVSSATLAEVGLPEGVKEVIGLRLSRLSADANVLLAAAAVIGQDVPHGLLREVVDLDDVAFEDAVLEATSPGLLAESTSGVLGYRFTHALVRATLLDELSTARRVGLHRRVGEAIEALHGTDDDEWLPVLAHHFGEAAPGGDASKAVSYRLRAGRRALDLNADDEALDHFDAGLALLDDLGLRDDEARFELLLGRGETLRGLLNHDFIDTLVSAATIARRMGGDQLAGRLARVGLAGDTEGPLATDEPAWRQVIDDALDALGPEPSGTRGLLLVVRAKTEFPGWQNGLVERRDEIARCFEACDDVRLAARIGYWLPAASPPEVLGDVIERLSSWSTGVTDPALHSLVEVLAFEDLLGRGDVEGARASAERVARLSEEVRTELRWRANVTSACMAQLAGDLDRAHDLLTENIDWFVDLPEIQRVIASQVGFVLYDQDLLSPLEEVMVENAADTAAGSPIVGLLDIGANDRARSLYDEWVDRMLDRPPAAMLGHEAAFAEATYRLGDVDRARRTYERLTPYADRVATVGVLYVQGSVQRSLGMMAILLEDFDRAVEHFDAACRRHVSMEAPILLARTQVEWADALIRRDGPGDRAEAERLLTEASERAAGHGAQAVVRLASARFADLR